MFFFKLTACQVVFFFIGLRVHVWLTCCNQSWVVQKPVNANLGLKVKNDFSHYLCSVLCEIVMWKCEQILCVTSDIDEQAAKPKFVAQSRPALHYLQQVDHAR